MAQFVWCDEENAKVLLEAGFVDIVNNGVIYIFPLTNKIIEYIKLKNIKVKTTNRLFFKGGE